MQCRGFGNALAKNIKLNLEMYLLSEFILNSNTDITAFWKSQLLVVPLNDYSVFSKKGSPLSYFDFLLTVDLESSDNSVKFLKGQK